jgi:anionic cell wall polymer biosynthesis LytR-Cps2A-Psr (LCP) family protein
MKYISSLSGSLALSTSREKETTLKLYITTMNANATSNVPYEAIQFAIRENFPSTLEPATTLGNTLNSIRTKVNTLYDIVYTTINQERGQEMTNLVDELLEETAQVEEHFKVWLEKLNLACVMIKLVYPQQVAAPGTK